MEGHERPDPVDQSVTNNLDGAARKHFLTRLEDESNAAGGYSVPLEQNCGVGSDRGVGVVSACVHHSVDCAAKRH